MAVVNSRFLSIGSGEPNVNSGWTIRVLDYKDMKSLVAVVSEFASFSFTQELNGPGEGSITLDQDSPFWAGVLRTGWSNRTLLDNEYIFEAWENNVPRFAWLGQTVTNTLIGENEDQGLTISGPGIAAVLKWAVLSRPGWPAKVPIIGYKQSTAQPKVKDPIYRATSYNDKLPAFSWRFPVTWSSMRMWYTVFRAAQRRGVIPWVSPMFTYLADSAKQPWQVVKTIEGIATGEGYAPPDRNQNLLDFLNDCTGQDYSKWLAQRLEWIMYPGFRLDVRPSIGADKSTTVRFFSGNILSDERSRDREEIYNRVVASDVIGGESIRTDKNSVIQWNLREQWNTSNQQITDDRIRGQLADRYIQQTAGEKDQWTIKIPYDDPGRIPYHNFFVGDSIGINADYHGSIPSSTGGPAPYRVMAITISLTADQTVPDCELTLRTLLDSKMTELEKQITQIINNPIDIGKLTDLVYNPKTGKWESPNTSSSDSSGGSGGGGTGGDGTGTGSLRPQVFIQKTDPATVTGTTVAAGDFWLETYE